MLSSWDVLATVALAVAAVCVAWAQPPPDAAADPASALERSVEVAPAARHVAER